MLHISLLGALEISLDGQTVKGFDSNKGRALLAYLAVEANRPHSREFLAGLLWPEQPRKKALHSLRQSLSALRKALGDRTADHPFLLIQGDTVQFNSSSEYWLDVHAFETNVRQALSFARRQKKGGRVQIRALKRAVALYTADFLDQFYLADSVAFDEWAIIQRAALQRQALEALTLLAEYHERRGEYALACQAATRLAELAPWDETAHGRVMRLLAIQGQWSAAQAYYRHCCRTLRDELGLDPAPETVKLAREIRQAALRGAPFPTRFHAPPARLPSAHLPFVGREAELDELADKLADARCRMIALLGPGGVGKTRLALEAAGEQAGLWRDGVFFVPLTATPAAEYAAPAVAAALHHNLIGRRSPEEQLVDLLRDKELLLVVDNLEHLPDTADLWAAILRHAPGVKLLATSRQPPNLRACQVIEVRGLDLPAEGKPARPLADYAALQLFRQTANRLQPGFRLAENNEESVARVCRLLDGSPLGIELAAAWIREVPVPEIARQIQADLDFLASTRRDVPPRHRSMRSVFAHSWRLLDAEERRTLAALSVFRGGFSVAAARRVADASPARLATLAAKSLLQRQDDDRYQLHGLLRRFAAEKLAEQGREAQVRARHAACYADLLQTQVRAWQASQERAVLDAIGLELENARVAWRWAVDGAHRAEIEKMAPGLILYHRLRGPFQLGERLLSQATERLAADAAEEAILLLARLYGEQAKFHLELGDYEQAATLAQQAIDLAQQAGSDEGQAAGHIRLGESLYRRGKHQAAQEHLERALTLSQRAGDRAWEATSLRHLGNVAYFAGDLDAAQQHYGRSADLFGQIGDHLHRAFVRHNLANILVQRGEHGLARTLFEENIQVYRRVGAQFDEAMSLLNLAVVRRRQGEYVAALEAYHASLDTCRQLGARLGESIALLNLGSLLAYLGDYEGARGRYEQALKLYRAIGDRQGEASALTSLGLMYHELGDQAAAREYSQQSLTIAQALDDPLRQANALMHLGHALAAEAASSSWTRLREQAADAYEQALRIRRDLGQEHLAMDALAGLAHVAQLAGRMERARAYVDEILAYRQSRLAAGRHGLEDSGEPFRILLVCYQVLHAQRDPRADELLATAHRGLQREAARIGDEALRRSFLEEVAVNRRIGELVDW